MKREFRNLNDFITELQSDTALQEKFKADPVAAAHQIQEHKTPLDTDPWIYRVVVFSLGVAIVSIIIGILILIGTGHISNDKSVPTILTAIGSAAIGALAGLLAPSPKKNNS